MPARLRLLVDPILLRLGPLEVRYYGVLLTLSFILGYFWLRRLPHQPTRELADQLTDCFLTIALGGLLGAKILSLLLAWLEGSDNLQFTIYNLLNGGGLSFHGGLLGGVLGAWLYTKRHPTFPLLKVADHLALYLPIGIILVRFGNFINQELIGPPTARPWGIIFARVDDFPRHPTPLYEALAAGIILLILYLVRTSKLADQQTGNLFTLFLLLYSAGRFTTDFFREHTLYSGLSLAQWTSIVLFALSLWFLVRRPLSASV